MYLQRGHVGWEGMSEQRSCRGSGLYGERKEMGMGRCDKWWECGKVVEMFEMPLLQQEVSKSARWWMLST